MARSRAAVLRSARELLIAGGPGAVTVDAVVARSGVAKSTIYRHWASRDDLLLAVIEDCAPWIVPPDPAQGFAMAFRDLVGQLRDACADPEWTRVLPAVLMLRDHQDSVADLEERLEASRGDALRTVLQQGVVEGVLHADVDLDAACAQLVGPLLFAQLMGRPEVDAAFVDRAVTCFLAGFAV